MKILNYPNKCKLYNVNKNKNTALQIAIKSKMEEISLKILDNPNKCNLDNINKYGNHSINMGI